MNGRKDERKDGQTKDPSMCFKEFAPSRLLPKKENPANTLKIQTRNRTKRMTEPQKCLGIRREGNKKKKEIRGRTNTNRWMDIQTENEARLDN